MIAVIGAGPVGIYLSKMLSNSGINVELFEAGGEANESTLLNRDSYKFISKSKMPKNVHRVGGGSNYWHSRIGEFLEEDFYELPNLKVAGWPFGKDELIHHYKKVAEDLTGNSLCDDDFLSLHFSKQIAQLSSNLELRLFRFAENFSFMSEFQTLKERPNVKIRTETKVERISIDRDTNGYFIEARTRKGVEEFKAKYVVIAAGTLQTTQILLNSQQLISQSNDSIIGFGLMEHLEGYIGLLRVQNGSKSNLESFALSRKNRIEPKSAGIGIRLNSNIQTSLQLPSVHVEIRPKPRIIKSRESIFISLIPNPIYFMERLLKKLNDGCTRLLDLILGRSTYGLYIKSEEFRNLSSSVYLNSKNGTKELVYDHRVSSKSYSQLFIALELLVPEIKEMFNARIKLFSWMRTKSQNIDFEANWHPMGTLPMGMDQESSICDKDLEIHQAKNIFLLSAAVFNRGSSGNPTFTTLALASRLAQVLIHRVR